jgi:[ribosomal protein S5]-alanine N-acetyltransferase
MAATRSDDHAREQLTVATAYRLQIVPATPELTRAALDGPHQLAAGLGAAVPATWPPEYLDAPALNYTLDRLSEGPEQSGWWLHFIVLEGDGGETTLIGSGGYKGPPSADGTVEVGYGIVSDQRRKGFASRATRELVARAFAFSPVRRVIAETLPELTPSIGVLRKCGFRLIGEGSEPGVIRFELTRAEYAAGAGGRAGGTP